jgi:methylmalonyl-CoA mutase
MSEAPLAADFPEPSAEAWLGLVEKTLKGQPLERLIVRGAGGLETRPLYTADGAATPLADAARFDISRSQGAGRWDVRTIIDHPDPAQAQADALKDLENGGNSLLLRIDPTGEDGVAVGSAADMARVLEGVEIDLAPVALDAGWLAPQAGEWLHAIAKSAPRAKLALHMDPLGAFAEQGASPGPVEAHVTRAARLAERLAADYADASFFLASGRVVHEAGGGEALELGVMAASVVAYVRAMTDAGMTSTEALPRIVVGLSADGEYFTTLSKFRAARAIWARLAMAYGATTPIRIEGRASRRMLSRLDPWVNLLRLTAAGFGAAVGGADAIVLEPFTQPLGRASAFARRQARNTQLVLMEESALARVEDPAGGCWFLEDQTNQLARSGWAALQEIERRGGLAEALKDGYIAEATAQARAVRAKDIATRKAGLIGVSVFPNLGEAGVEVIHVDPNPLARSAPDPRQPGADSACTALAHWRAAEPFERLRRAACQAAERPKVHLAIIGSDAAARVGFVQGLVAAGGMTATSGPAAEYAGESSVVVLCGADPDYGEHGVEAARALKAAGATRLYLAGKPGELEGALKAAGVDSFLYLGGDATAVLHDMQAAQGVVA